MKSNAIAPGSWSTASFGGSPDTSPIELSSLGEHLGLCKPPRGHLFALRCAAETLRGFMLARFVTTSVVIVLLIGLATMVV